MISQQRQDDSWVIASDLLRLSFARSGGLWTHRLAVGRGDAIRPFAEAFEAAPPIDPGRVVSPTFQELHVQEGDGSITALLVGNSGPHHFSASFAVIEADYQQYNEENATYVIVDIADRCRVAVEALASTYAMASEGVHLWSGDPASAEWFLESRSGIGPFQVRLSSVQPTDPSALPSIVSLAKAGAGPQYAQISVSPVLGGATHRWKYVWEVTTE